MAGWEPPSNNSSYSNPNLNLNSSSLSPSLLQDLNQPFNPFSRKRHSTATEEHEEEKHKRSRNSFNLESLSLNPPTFHEIPILDAPPLQQLPSHLYTPSLLSTSIPNIPITPPLQQGPFVSTDTPTRIPLHPSPDFHQTTGLGITSPIQSLAEEVKMGTSYEISPHRIVITSLDDEEEEETVEENNNFQSLHPRIFLEQRALQIPYQIEIFGSPESSQLVLFDPLVKGKKSKSKVEDQGVKIEELLESDMELESLQEGITEEVEGENGFATSSFVWPPVIVEPIEESAVEMEDSMDLDD